MCVPRENQLLPAADRMKRAGILIPRAFVVCGYSLDMESSKRLEELRSVGSGASWAQRRALVGGHVVVTHGRNSLKHSTPGVLGCPIVDLASNQTDT